MTDHQKFEALLNELGLSRRELAQELDIKYTSITNQLAPAKDLPKWAKSMLLVQERRERKEKTASADGEKKLRWNTVLYGEANCKIKRIMEEKIICSAIWYKELELKKPEVLEPRNYRPNNCDRGIVFCGWRHPNCLYQMVAITGKRQAEVGDYESGFLTNKNRFVGRKEGAKIALETNQIEKLQYGKQLFSEDLW